MSVSCSIMGISIIFAEECERISFIVFGSSCVLCVHRRMFLPARVLTPDPNIGWIDAILMPDFAACSSSEMIGDFREHISTNTPLGLRDEISCMTSAVFDRGVASTMKSAFTTPSVNDLTEGKSDDVMAGS